MKVRKGDFARKSSYRPVRMNVEQFIQNIRRGDYAEARESRSAFELFRGRPYYISRNYATRALLDRAHEALVEAVPEGALKVVRGDRWVLCTPHDVLAAPLMIAVADKTLVNVRDAVLVVDVAAGSGADRARLGRRIYLESGLRNHWLIDPVEGFLEETSQGVTTRIEAGGTVPIAVDGVVYGRFPLDDLFVQAG